jgi:hypothetical protein
MRNPPPRNLILEALLEERDHLKIQINLLEHGPTSDGAKLQSMRGELQEIEKCISRHQPGY